MALERNIKSKPLYNMLPGIKLFYNLFIYSS